MWRNVQELPILLCWNKSCMNMVERRKETGGLMLWSVFSIEAIWRLSTMHLELDSLLIAMLKCGDVAGSWIYMTKTNPARRFMGCPNFKRHRKCNYFQWIDPELSNWFANKMVEFIELKKEDEEEIRKLKLKLWYARMMTFVIICCNIMYLMFF
ncbi:uncharacterized protein [Rutidosis leptorrhynchoides]|uniref:uncharacterized protein n=1 Tax=Rutidosis leptorrhynchoides TaxID=125765 RepID=UPI003A995DED